MFDAKSQKVDKSHAITFSIFFISYDFFFFNHFFMDIALFPNAVFRALEPTRKLPGSGQRPEKRWHWGNFFKLYDVLRPR